MLRVLTAGRTAVDANFRLLRSGVGVQRRRCSCAGYAARLHGGHWLVTLSGFEEWRGGRGEWLGVIKVEGKIPQSGTQVAKLKPGIRVVSDLKAPV